MIWRRGFEATERNIYFHCEDCSPRDQPANLAPSLHSRQTSWGLAIRRFLGFLSEARMISKLRNGSRKTTPRPLERNQFEEINWNISCERSGLLGCCERATFSSLYWLPHDGKYWVCGLLTADQRNLLGVGMINPSHGAPSVCQYKAPLTLSRGLPSIGFTWQDGNIFLSLFEEWNQNFRISPRISRIPKVFFLAPLAKFLSLNIHSVYWAV